MIPIPLIEFPSAFSFGENVAKAPIPGMTVRSPPDTPLLVGTPQSLVNFPAPLYIPQVVIIVTTAWTVWGLKILLPVDGMIPLFASIAPKLARD